MFISVIGHMRFCCLLFANFFHTPEYMIFQVYNSLFTKNKWFSQCTNTRLCFRLLGVDKLFSYAINEWLNDIKKNQLPGLLGGVGPIHSLVQLGEYNKCS